MTLSILTLSASRHFLTLLQRGTGVITLSCSFLSDTIHGLFENIYRLEGVLLTPRSYSLRYLSHFSSPISPTTDTPTLFAHNCNHWENTRAKVISDSALERHWFWLILYLFITFLSSIFSIRIIIGIPFRCPPTTRILPTAARTRRRLAWSLIYSSLLVDL